MTPSGVQEKLLLLLSNGQVMVPLGKLAFPRICIVCAAPTSSLWEQPLGLFSRIRLRRSYAQSPISVPRCEECAKRSRSRQTWIGGGLLAAVILVLLAVVVSLAALPLFDAEIPRLVLFVVPLLPLAVSGWIWAKEHSAYGVRLVRLSEDEKLATLEFSHVDVARGVFELYYPELTKQ